MPCRNSCKTKKNTQKTSSPEGDEHLQHYSQTICIPLTWDLRGSVDCAALDSQSYDMGLMEVVGLAKVGLGRSNDRRPEEVESLLTIKVAIYLSTV